MVNLHHPGKDAVVILPEHLTGHKGKDTEHSTHYYLVKLPGIFRFRNSEGIEHFLLQYGPTFPVQEAGYELIGRELSPELGGTVHLKFRKYGTQTGYNLPKFGIAVLIDTGTGKPFLIGSRLDSVQELYQCLGDIRVQA